MHMQDKSFIPAALVLVALGFAGCKKDEPAPPPPQPVQKAPPPPSTELPKEKPVYVYSGDRFRDPFVPAGFTGGYTPDAPFDPAKASVKGIIFGTGQRTAVLTTGAGGTYFVKSGKIFDVMGKTVEGFTAKVMADKVVLTGEADNVYELKIRNEEEKAL